MSEHKVGKSLDGLLQELHERLDKHDVNHRVSLDRHAMQNERLEALEEQVEDMELPIHKDPGIRRSAKVARSKVHAIAECKLEWLNDLLPMFHPSLEMHKHLERRTHPHGTHFVDGDELEAAKAEIERLKEKLRKAAKEEPFDV